MSVRILPYFILASCLLLGEVGWSPRSALADDDEETQAALQTVRKKIDRLRNDIQKSQTLHDSVRTELARIEKDMGRLYRNIRDLKKKLAGQKRKLDKLYAQRKTLRKDVETQLTLLEKQIRAAYMIGRQEYIKLLLNQEDPALIGRTMAYYDYFNRARVARISLSRKSLKALIATEKSIKRESAALEEIQQQQLAKQASLQETSRSRALVMAQLSQEIKGKEQDLSQLLKDEKRLSDLVTRLDEAIPDILTAPGKRTPFEKLKGRLDWPTKGAVQALFGKLRESSRVKWNGVMIRAGEGSEVRAISHGRIAFADWLRGYGLLVIIDHGGGYMSLYGHNQTIYKETGEWVEAGEAIASVGSSGGRQQAGLYFEIRHNGKPTNPSSWCRRG